MILPLTPSENLITRTAMYIAAVNHTALPPMNLHIDNPIPLGRGLGSSGAAVVAGVILADQACRLHMSKEKLLDYCLLIEGHPDNVTASLIGGFCSSYLAVSVEAEHAELHALSKKKLSFDDASVALPIPPAINIGRYVQWPISPSIRAVTIVPQFELSTHLARSVLPQSYPRADVVFNLQRLAVLTSALCTETPSADLIYNAMQDKLHQHYRQHLVPGLPKILSLTPKELPGLLGICVSGAGPTVLALATSNFEAIGKAVQQIWRENVGADGKPIDSEYYVLDFIREGATWECKDV
ncbi:GHMP kinase [Gaertneriomyces semiglobifer]|nr:GHMP kinase [Gaertneriomyces semiglobifer]